MIHAALTAAFNVVFNRGVNDSALIDRLGGPAEVARLLGYGHGGTQRVHNWKQRGIPAAVKLARPDLFLPGFRVEPVGPQPAAALN